MQKHYFDRKTKSLKPLHEGDSVSLQTFVKSNAPWAKGQVLRQLDDRSYEVRAGDQTYRRNRVHLKATNEPEDIPKPASTTRPDELVSHTPPRSPTETKTTVATKPQCAQQGKQTVVPMSTPETRKTSSLPKPTQTPSRVITRSGRTIRVPEHLKDFKTDIKN
jgi:hypothetical protein